MTEQILLCIPTVTQYDLCIKELQSAEAGTLKPSYVIIDNGGNFMQRMLAIDPTLPDQKVNVINFGKNLGCASSWNIFLKEYPPESICIIANDDLTFESDAIEHLIDCYNQHKDNPSVGMITLHGINAHSHYCCFIVTKTAIEKVGYFDETFYPAYYEDCDYDYRLRLAGLTTIFADKGIYHHVGSATHKALTPEQLEEHHKNFTKNKNYYEAKWGGELYAEKFTIPFGVDTNNCPQ